MKTISSHQYLYSSTLSRTKETGLLSRAEAENLAHAENNEELLGNLQETFIGVYLAGQNKSTEVFTASNRALADIKRDIIFSLPKNSVLEPVWAYYDFINRDFILKMRELSKSSEEIESMCSLLGNIEPRKMLKELEAGNLVLKDRDYLTYISRVGPKRDPFMKGYLLLLGEQIKILSIFKEEALDTSRHASTDSALNDIWEFYVKRFRDTKNSALLEFAKDRIMLQYVSEHGSSLFSYAPSLHYFLSAKLSLETIHSIITGFAGGFKSEDLLYHLNEKYARPK
jgi:vacuolar-type H+-ATPase subunit C/Vma6